ncbi:MAG: ABC transporter substrate-binding protein [Actinobacteria bacterium]|nr:ABC transporter substrate-binding protein [Actinomycetota bacterium]
MSRPHPIARLLATITAAVGALAVPVAAAGAPAQGGDDGVTLRLGYFANVTHAPALVGIEAGIYEENLGDNVTLDTSTFTAGPQAVEAIFSDALDITYIGPNPAINAFAQSDGEAVRIISGAASGGAFFVVQPDIEKPKDLEGKTIATPQLGNTQDVALRNYLEDKSFETDPTGGGDVSIVPQDNAQTLELFTSGDIDGAWVPEPWATRLVDEGGGEILVDEADLWPDGRYVTTHIIVRTEFLEENPGVVKQFLEGHVAANRLIADDPAQAQELVGQAIDSITGKPIAPELVAASFESIEFTNDPIASSLRQSAKDAEAADLLDPVDLDGIYSLKLLNQVLKAAGEPTVKGK